APRMHASAGDDPEALTRRQAAPRQKADRARGAGRRDRDATGEDRVDAGVARHEMPHLTFSTIGKSTVMNLMAAGPMVTIQIAGKMQTTSGNTILTPVFAAASSARWRRLVRSVSEYTRSDWATLVPNLSVWISIATSEMTSSTPVRSPRFLNASTRFIPPRS